MATTAAGRQIPRKINSKVLRAMPKYLVLALALIFFLFPIIWIALTSFKLPEEYLRHPPVWIPRSPTLAHFRAVLQLGGYDALAKSLIVASFSTLLALATGCPAAYSLARYRTGGKHLPFWILSQRMLPPIAVVFPVFLLFREIGWIDTYQALILMYLTFNLPYVVWMMRGFFAEIPVEIEESAFVDGCSVPQTIVRITLPLSAPGLIATATFCFIFSWSEFIFALVLSRTNMLTLPLFLSHLFGKMMVFWGEIGAVSVIAMLPIFLLSLMVQRYLVRGLTMGAVK